MFNKILAGGLLACVCASASAGVITSATSAVINSGGPGFGSITDTHNQNGLSSGYVSGVTDFMTYLSSNPSHTDIFSGFEWFSEVGSDSASVTYDLGAILAVSGMALWNEESSGIGNLNLFYSTDGVNFLSLASGISPTDNGAGSYLADIITFGTVNAQFIRLDMSRCPQPVNGIFVACAIGEVAFDVEASAVPEPATLTLLGLGLVGLIGRRRKV